MIVNFCGLNDAITTIAFPLKFVLRCAEMVSFSLMLRRICNAAARLINLIHNIINKVTASSKGP